MAASFISGSVIGMDALYQVVRAALASAGWSEIDVLSDSPSNREIVFRSAALSTDAQNYAYCKGKLTPDSFIYQPYSDWDTTTHVGARRGVANDYTTSLFENVRLFYYIRVDEWAVMVVVVGHRTSPAEARRWYFGFLDRAVAPHKAGLSRTTLEYTKGATVLSLASNLTGQLIPGQLVLVLNHGHDSTSGNFENGERVVVDSVGVGTVTLRTPLLYNYDAGAVVGWSASPIVASFPTTSGIGSPYMCHRPDGAYVNDLTGWGVGASLNNQIPPSVKDDLDLTIRMSRLSGHYAVAGLNSFMGFVRHCYVGSYSFSAFGDTAVADSGTYLCFDQSNNFFIGPM